MPQDTGARRAAGLAQSLLSCWGFYCLWSLLFFLAFPCFLFPILSQDRFGRSSTLVQRHSRRDEGRGHLQEALSGSGIWWLCPLSACWLPLACPVPGLPKGTMTQQLAP